jgi:hypothetical protein
MASQGAWMAQQQRFRYPNGGAGGALSPRDGAPTTPGKRGGAGSASGGRNERPKVSREPTQYNIHMRDELRRLKAERPDLDHKAAWKMASGSVSAPATAMPAVPCAFASLLPLLTPCMTPALCMCVARAQWKTSALNPRPCPAPAAPAPADDATAAGADDAAAAALAAVADAAAASAAAEEMPAATPAVTAAAPASSTEVAPRAQSCDDVAAAHEDKPHEAAGAEVAPVAAQEEAQPAQEAAPDAAAPKALAPAELAPAAAAVAVVSTTTDVDASVVAASPPPPAAVGDKRKADALDGGAEGAQYAWAE